MHNAFKIKLAAHGISDKGDSRPIDEDRILIKKYDIANEEWGMFLVADGMGAKGRGGEASQIIVDVLSSWWENELATILSMPFEPDLLFNSLDTAIATANANVLKLQAGEMMGSTLSLLFMMGQKYMIKHVGDSRIYLLNKERGVRQLTKDHTYVASQMRAGLLTAAEAKVHPKRNVVTQVIGAKPELNMFYSEGECMPDDMFLLCSDGFHNLVPEKTILDIAFNSSDITEKVTSLRGSIDAGKAYDNVSIVLVHPAKQN